MPSMRTALAALWIGIGACAPPVPVDDAGVCDNSVDEDGDGRSDCADLDCIDRCDEVCVDALDNDGDELVDCADPDCDGSCPEACADGRDNDGDGKTDCADRDCIGSCPEVCGDGLDNDDDGAVDCTDSDCDGHCPEDCTDGRDNDGDGAIDCADDECQLGCPEDCDDGLDNDGDGWTDCDDLDCTDSCPETCDNDRDDDADGLIDCADEECRSTCDSDGDGYDAQLHGGDDCDDTNPAVFPGAVEVCDGIDNDCDGLFDMEDPSIDRATTSVFHTDMDLDGFGNRRWQVTDCFPPAGWAADDTDCNDRDAAVNPAAIEICNTVDDDCDALIDDADPDTDPASMTTWYLDADGDTHGDPATAVTLCVAPSLHVDNGDDCDDTDPLLGAPTMWLLDVDGDGYGSGVPVGPSGCVPPSSEYAPESLGVDCDDGDVDVHPGATDTCEDGVDQDCDGLDEWCHVPLIGVVSLGLAEAKFIGEAAADAAGRSVSGAGDVNADGFDDLLVGAHGWDSGLFNEGAAYLILGPASGDADLSAAHARLEGEGSSDAAGYSVSGAGDVDADGFDDVVVGAFNNDTGGFLAGAAYLVLGPISGMVDLSFADSKLVGEASEDGAGYSVAGAGDLNSDGFNDLIIGAYEEDAGDVDAGAAYLLLGPVAGVIDLSAADAKLVGEWGSDNAGHSVAGAGDVDGDGFDDVLVGAPGASGAGAAYLVQGPVSGEVDLSAADARLAGEATNDQAGTSVSGAGDVDADGHDDVLVGARWNDHGGTSSGSAYLTLGPVSGLVDLAATDARFVGEAIFDWVGSSVAGAGDVDGDGFDDVLIGAESQGAGASADKGAAYLVLGPVSGVMDVAAAQAKLTGEFIYDYAGSSVSGAGDVDGDGFDDLFVGADGYGLGGAAYLTYGGSL